MDEKKFLKPEMDIILFAIEDIIITSNEDVGDIEDPEKILQYC